MQVCVFFKDNEDKDLKSVQTFPGKMYINCAKKELRIACLQSVFEIFVDTVNICSTGPRHTVSANNFEQLWFEKFVFEN